MYILEAIDPTIFFITLGIGLFFSYMTAKTPRIIYKYPTPLNYDKLTYTDNVGNCYKYNAKEVVCPKDIAKITPVQFQ